MKRPLPALFLLLLFTSSYAQVEEKGDKRSIEILNAVRKKTETYTSFRAEFTYKMENREAGIDESKSGTLLVKGDKYRLEIAGQLVISNGETLWTYLADAQEVQVNSVGEGEETLSPANLLSSYDEDYRSKFIRETFLYGTTAEVIDLTPVEGKSYYKIRITIDKDKSQILDFTIFDKNGSTYSYIIAIFQANVPVDESEFRFVPSEHPDVEVIDMR
ncbi:MAG: outer membrane lipoprotein carrier protein LolA [Bacteroidales bacterium]|nr:outer membrane lipoprotein carrier protein LolA [Bacteroidales bacterium]